MPVYKKSQSSIMNANIDMEYQPCQDERKPKPHVSDAVLFARFCTEDSTAVITDQGKRNADVNHDGNIELDDVTAILRKIARLD